MTFLLNNGGVRMCKSSKASRMVIVLAFAFTMTNAGNVMKDTTISGLRIELHVMQAEPFFTKDEVAAKKVNAGMLIVKGAKPLAPDAEVRPDHHLVVHVFDAKTGKALTNANVKMGFQPVSEKGDSATRLVEVPVVVMQAIGKGAKSTHYGNNVVMPDGQYVVSVEVNGVKAGFSIDLSNPTNGKMEGMDMH
jgi:hypothetical protein